MKLGATLLTEDLDAFRGLLDSGYDLCDFDDALPRALHVLSALEHWFSARQVPIERDLNEVLRNFVSEINWRVEFDKLLQLALGRQPTSYWDIVGRDNPRRGDPTVRRTPRYRKTANGMRQDGTGSIRPLPVSAGPHASPRERRSG